MFDKRERGEDFRWNRRRPVRPSDLSSLNDVAIFAGTLLGMYPALSRENIKVLMDMGMDFVLLDVTEREEYESGHICGAVNIPVREIEFEALGRLRKDDLIIVYCGNERCAASAVAVDKLYTLAYEHVMRYPGGLKDWKAAGWCVEAGVPEKKKAA